MLTDEEIEIIGVTLEGGGFTHAEIDEYFEHSGVRGMKWGVRRQLNKQRVMGTITRANEDALDHDTQRKLKIAAGVGAVVVAGVLLKKGKLRLPSRSALPALPIAETILKTPISVFI